MTKKEIQLKRKLELQKYKLEYQSNQEHYDKETILMLALQQAYIERLEEQMKVNPNHLLKKLHFALNEWINEPVISIAMNEDKDDSINQLTQIVNLGYEAVEYLETKIKQ